MFWSKRISSLQEAFSKENERLKEEISALQARIDDMRKSVEKSERIIKNHAHGKITYKTEEDFRTDFHAFRNPFRQERCCAYLYRDVKEYKIDGLRLVNPTFLFGELDNILYIRDALNDKKATEVQYLVDLYDCSFRKIN